MESLSESADTFQTESLTLLAFQWSFVGAAGVGCNNTECRLVRTDMERKELRFSSLKKSLDNTACMYICVEEKGGQCNACKLNDE